MENNTNNNPASRPRITPRNSDLEESTATADTPWRTLNQLANIPRTPSRRASSVGPPSTHRSQRRTPAALQRGGSAKRPAAVTPHGRAAQRDMDVRRAGLTPGKDRRRSGRQQRETPRDALRALSRMLAPKTLPVIPTPQGQNTSKHPLANDDWEDGPELERPRFSLPFGEDDEDDSLLLPPQSAGLEDENFTVQSVEFGRRAHSEKPLSRMSRGSFGSIMMSDGFEDSRLDRMSEMFDSSIFQGDGRGDVPFLGDDEELRGEYTGVLSGLGMDRGRISLAGRDSDIQPLNAGERDDTDTFVFNVPPRAITEEASSPLPYVENSPRRLDLNQDEEEEEVDDPEQDEEMNKLIEILDEEDEDEEEDEDPVDEINADAQDTSMLQDLTADLSMAMSEGVQTAALTSNKTARKKQVKISKHGLQYPSLPAGVVKKLATTFARTAGNSKSKLSKETLDAIMQASEWFFEQASDDLSAYSGHAGRKTIEESDVVTLMTRQRQINASTTPFSLAQKHLPRELLQELRMVPPAKVKGGRKLPRVQEQEEEEAIEVDE